MPSGTSRPADQSARSRILAAAREVFVAKGFELATVRDITLRAGVNVASIHYHFGSKDGLINEVLNEMMQPYTRARLTALEAHERAPGGLTLEGVMDALIRPMVMMSRDEAGQRPLTHLVQQVRARPSPTSAKFFVERVDPVVLRFIEALQQVAPGLSRAEVFWRYNFTIGAIMQVLIDSDPDTRRLKRLSGGMCDTDDDEELIRQLMAYCCGSFRAPSVSRSPVAAATP
ncbi:TetR/AcrR family transcriptional regulator [Paenirhodobacter sp.]|uniref:TetR/AcrR family transcriptional regulator n=1 Tax=Paenirhodobacter sp. TaxID=1965326 RepID=UPI003B3E9D85